MGPDDFDYLLAGESLSPAGALLIVASNVVITSGDVFTNVTNDLLNSLPSSAFSNQIVVIFSFPYSRQYSLSAGNGATEIVAVVNVSFYEEDIVASVPEPSSFLLLASGMALVGCAYGCRKRASV